MKMVRRLVTVLAAFAVAVLLFDVAAYFLAPKAVTSFARLYRAEARDKTIYGDSGYPKGYFRADEVSGFEIQENHRPTTFTFLDSAFEIFSNDVGCYDRHNLAELKSRQDYDYFAGDSFTWSYAPYDNKFPAVYERLTNRLSAKCGIPHAGQLHEFVKFKRTVGLIGHYPRTVIVAFVTGDPSNDYIYPNATVVGGYLVQEVVLNNFNPVRKSISALETELAQFLSAQQSESLKYEDVKGFLLKYSLSANLVQNARWRMSIARLAQSELVASGDGYLTDPRAQRNREAIAKWAEDANSNSYRLIFLLVPPKWAFDQTNYYSGLKQYLGSLGVAYVDMAEHFRRSNKSVRDLYWEFDGHWNIAGNEYVGHVLAEELGPTRSTREDKVIGQ